MSNLRGAYVAFFSFAVVGLVGCGAEPQGGDEGGSPNEPGRRAGRSSEIQGAPAGDGEGSNVSSTARALSDPCPAPMREVYGGYNSWGFDVSGKDHADPIPTPPSSGKCSAGYQFGTATGTPGCNFSRLHPEDVTDCSAVVSLHTNAFSGGACDWAICETPIQTQAITVLSATYGLNCGAPLGNQTSTLAAYCNGVNKCSYAIDYRRIGDPAVNCAKTYEVTYVCTGSSTPRSAYVPPEAGFGSVVQLDCTH